MNTRQRFTRAFSLARRSTTYNLRPIAVISAAHCAGWTGNDDSNNAAARALLLRATRSHVRSGRTSSAIGCLLLLQQTEYRRRLPLP